MLIDNDKFIGLLVENSGIEKEKIEKYLDELISDVKTALSDGEAYEVDGFGVFSKLGNNVFFIPSEELETEINYKYVGMEPLELPGIPPQEEEDLVAEENPITGILDTEDNQDYEDPFVAIFGDKKEDDSDIFQEDNESTFEEQDLVEAAVEEEIEEETVEDIFNEISDEIESEEDLIEETHTSEEQEDIFEDSLSAQSSEEEPTPGPEQWGIEAHKEDDTEDAFAGLLGGSLEDKNKDGSNEDPTPEENIDFSALDDADEEDFDDPFAEIQDEDDEDFVPVVTNVSSGKTTTQEEEPSEQKRKKKLKKEKKSKAPTEKKASPTLLYVVLVLVIALGGGYIAAYFGVVNISGITPSKYQPQVAQTNTPQVQQPSPTQVQPASNAEQPTDQNTIPVNDQTSPGNTNSESVSKDESSTTETVNNSKPSDIAPPRADEKSPGDGGIISPVSVQAGSDDFGLNGTATEAGNNGYTIVLYTLSKKTGADAQFEKLSKEGYRVIIKEKPSEKYGTLYRVSIGQFETLADAAIAAEKVDSKTLGNYIITKI